MRLLKVSWTKIVLGILDGVFLNSAILLSFWLRFEGDISHEYLTRYLHTFWWVTPVTIIVYYFFGLYNRIWQYASVDALGAVFLGVTAAALVMAAGMVATVHYIYPRSVLALTWLLSLLFIGGSRFTWRVMRERIYGRNLASTRQLPSRKVLIYGAGSAGAMLAARMLTENQTEYELEGFIDDDPRKVGMRLGRRKVLGTSQALASLVKSRGVNEVIIAVPSASGKTLRKMVGACSSANVPCKVIPSVLELVDGRVDLGRVRSVEVEDLLGREPSEFDIGDKARYLKGAKVLVTGAGGSIGSEICRQICRFSPKQLILFGRGENRVHQIYTELAEAFPQIRLTPVIGSFTISAKAEKTFKDYRPDVVFHAGAHKHVYLMELHPEEAVWNNVIGTVILARLAQKYQARRFIFISTDKAVKPTSVMGATKRLGELFCAGAGNDGPTGFVTVRFGNVLGSEGSVLRVWRSQIAAGRPLTVTDPEATRYFMTIPEAALLVLAVGGMGGNGEIFVLDMGDAVRIVNLAREVLGLSGLEDSAEGRVRFVGLRPGEKLHEELVSEDESTIPTDVKRIFRVVGSEVKEPWQLTEEGIEKLRLTAENGSPEDMRIALHEVLPEYAGVSTLRRSKDIE